jgi:hypothetical protein
VLIGLRSLLALDTKLPGGYCLTHVGREGVAAQRADPVRSSKIELPGDEEDFRKELLHSLGNLVIDSASPNASKGSDPFLKKESVYKGSPFMSQQELSRFAKADEKTGAPIWDREAVRKRGECLVTFALAEWNPERV